MCQEDIVTKKGRLKIAMKLALSPRQSLMESIWWVLQAMNPVQGDGDSQLHVSSQNGDEMDDDFALLLDDQKKTRTDRFVLISLDPTMASLLGSRRPLIEKSDRPSV